MIAMLTIHVSNDNVAEVNLFIDGKTLKFSQETLQSIPSRRGVLNNRLRIINLIENQGLRLISTESRGRFVTTYTHFFRVAEEDCAKMFLHSESFNKLWS
jgi:hypothetical protein